MRARVRIIGAAFVLLAALAGGRVAWATAGEDEPSVTGPGAERASAAALSHVGEGRVTGSERERGPDDGGAWEVEVTGSDGRSVDVELDASHRVVKVEGDTEENEPSSQDDADDTGR